MITPDLESDMIADATIIKLLKDDKIAREFYAAMCNMRWQKIDSGPEDEQIINKLKGIDPNIWSVGWRGSGGIIADLRNMFYNTNEDYIYYYCGGNEGFVSDTVNENFERMGWKQCPWDDDII